MSNPNNEPTPPQPAPARALKPEQALENLAMIAADYALKLREREIINHSILVLRDTIAELHALKNPPPKKKKAPAAQPPKGDAANA